MANFVNLKHASKIEMIYSDLAVLKANQEQYEKRVGDAYENAKSALRGDTRTFRYVTTFLGFGGIIIAGAQYLNAERLSTAVRDIELRADREIASMHKQVDEATKAATISSATIAPLPQIGSNGALVSPFIDGTTLNSSLSYKVVFSINLSVSAEGGGVGKIVGYFAKLEGPIIDVLAGASPSQVELIRTIQGAGDTWSFEKPLIVSPGSLVQINVKYQLPQRSCQEAEASLASMTQNGGYRQSFGTLTITPIFESIHVKPSPREFQLKLGDNTSLYDCKALQRFDRRDDSLLPNTAVDRPNATIK